MLAALSPRASLSADNLAVMNFDLHLCFRNWRSASFVFPLVFMLPFLVKGATEDDYVPKDFQAIVVDSEESPESNEENKTDLITFFQSSMPLKPTKINVDKEIVIFNISASAKNKEDNVLDENTFKLTSFASPTSVMLYCSLPVIESDSFLLHKNCTYLKGKCQLMQAINKDNFMPFYFFANSSCQNSYWRMLRQFTEGEKSTFNSERLCVETLFKRPLNALKNKFMQKTKEKLITNLNTLFCLKKGGKKSIKESEVSLNFAGFKKAEIFELVDNWSVSECVKKSVLSKEEEDEVDDVQNLRNPGHKTPIKSPEDYVILANEELLCFPKIPVYTNGKGQQSRRNGTEGEQKKTKGLSHNGLKDLGESATGASNKFATQRNLGFRKDENKTKKFFLDRFNLSSISTDIIPIPKTGTFQRSIPRVLWSNFTVVLSKDGIMTSNTNKTNSKEAILLVPGYEKLKGFVWSPLSSGLTNTSQSRNKRKIELIDVIVLKGSTAYLPCELKTEEADAVEVVLWMKEGIHTPIYSFDYRDMASTPKERKPDLSSDLAQRVTFHTDRTPAALVIKETQEDDSGVYRCRVDFHTSPSRNTRVNLTVVVPPKRVRIKWKLNKGEKSGTSLEDKAPSIPSVGYPTTDTSPGQEGLVGPFLEGQSPVLVCSNNEAWPTPKVLWYEGTQLLDDTFFVNFSTKYVVNEYKTEPLCRKDFGRRLTCIASNTNATEPATTTVKIDMTLEIVSVQIEELGEVEAAAINEIRCRVWGANPLPRIVWWLGTVSFPESLSQTECQTISWLFSPASSYKPGTLQTFDEGNVTLAILRLTASVEDDEALLTCQAINTKLGDQTLQDSRILSVSYIPQVSIALGHSLDPFWIKEGDDVYFECKVKSKPPIFRVQWKHNGNRLEDSSGYFVSNMSLVVQGVTRNRGGEYTCHATNVKGTGSSIPLNLDVKYAPVCSPDQKMQHSVAKTENAIVSCKVFANPPNVAFRWTFNNTAEAIDVPNGRFVVSGTESVVNYTPMTELDYGTLLCWANNSIGVQESPCVFHIVAAGKPDPPHNCKVFGVTISALQVSCLAGDDGGLAQAFILQVFQVGSASPVTEINKTVPSFSVSNLRPNTAYKLHVLSINVKGASKPTELKALTGKLPEIQEETNTGQVIDRPREETVPFALAMGVALAAVPLIILIVIITWFRTCRRNRRRRGGSCKAGRDCAMKGRESATTLTCKDSEFESAVNTPQDESNPDIISNTPADSLEVQEKDGREGTGIATISSSAAGYFLSNIGGGVFPTHVNLPSAIDYMQTAYVGEHQHSLCTQVPYPCRSDSGFHLLDHFQKSLPEVPLPPPPSYDCGYQPSSQCWKEVAFNNSDNSKCIQPSALRKNLPLPAYEGTSCSHKPEMPHLLQQSGGTFSQRSSRHSVSGTLLANSEVRHKRMASMTLPRAMSTSQDNLLDKCKECDTVDKNPNRYGSLKKHDGKGRVMEVPGKCGLKSDSSSSDSKRESAV